MQTQPYRIGIIGAGLMGKELASAIGRWIAIEPLPLRPELVAVADVNPTALEWFRRVPSVSQLTADYRELLKNPQLDAIYAAVPHHLHKELYLDVIRAGKDLLGEKPFGIDLDAARAISDAARDSNVFVRCSSEFPYLPGAQALLRVLAEERLGRILEIHAGFRHSSDLDPDKPINWKRQQRFCGEVGVMGDLGMHVMHLPLRLGWVPLRVHAQLQNVIAERPDGKGGMARCDTWDNATLNTDISLGDYEAPMRLEMKRMAPSETNTWFVEVLGTEAGVKFSTKYPKTLWIWNRKDRQAWKRYDLGHEMAFKTITGSIFEAGFPDAILQMWAAFLAEKSGVLGARLGPVTPEEAVTSHQVFRAALVSNREQRVVSVGSV
jgi:predicted dehydrogenase